MQKQRGFASKRRKVGCVPKFLNLSSILSMARHCSILIFPDGFRSRRCILDLLNRDGIEDLQGIDPCWRRAGRLSLQSPCKWLHGCGVKCPGVGFAIGGAHVLCRSLQASSALTNLVPIFADPRHRPPALQFCSNIIRIRVRPPI
jgi:hypothetical protein